MSTSREELQQQDEIGLLELPTELQKEIIAEVCDEPATLLPLRRINKSIRDTIDGSSLFRFYKSNYSYHAMTPQLGYYILNKNKMTAENFRLGNRMVVKGIHLYLKGSFDEAESLFINAICKHGSSNAMRVMFGLSTLPGRIKLTSLNDLYQLYSNRENEIIGEMVTNNFSLLEAKNCVALMNSVTDEINKDINCFRNAVNAVWMKDQGVSLANINELNNCFNEIRDAEARLVVDGGGPQFIARFDALGLFGIAEPSKDAWYNSPAASKSLSISTTNQ